MMQLILTGAAVTESLRSAHGRKDLESMRGICSGVPDETLEAIGDGDAEIRGDSGAGFEVWTVDRDYLVPTLIEGREQIDRADWIEVSGKSERTRERVLRGIMINMSDEYKCDPSDVVISTEGTLHAAIQTNLDGVKRAAKILNAGKG